MFFGSAKREELAHAHQQLRQSQAEAACAGTALIMASDADA